MQRERLAAAQSHRFWDFAALYVRPSEGKGVTVYLSPDEARAIGERLIAAADEISARPFSESTIGTFRLPAES